jgi:hypothetical protein
MRRKILLLMALLPLMALAQIDEMREKLNDQVMLIEEGKMTLRFVNAMNDEPVAEALVEIEGIGDFETDGMGRVIFDAPEKDDVFPIKFSKARYFDLKTTFEIAAGTIFYNRFAVSPLIARENLRIVFEWGKRPDDLDAHLEKFGDYHISYHNMKVSDDGEAKLDRDDRESYGPETITIKKIDGRATYSFYVKDYSNRDRHRSKQLSKSNAVVRLYDYNGLIREWRLRDKERGNVWQGFEIRNGNVNSIDNLKTQ